MREEQRIRRVVTRDRVIDEWEDYQNVEVMVRCWAWSQVPVFDLLLRVYPESFEGRMLVDDKSDVPRCRLCGFEEAEIPLPTWDGAD